MGVCDGVECCVRTTYRRYIKTTTPSPRKVASPLQSIPLQFRIQKEYADHGGELPLSDLSLSSAV